MYNEYNMNNKKLLKIKIKIDKGPPPLLEKCAQKQRPIHNSSVRIFSMEWGWAIINGTTSVWLKYAAANFFTIHYT